MEIRSQRSKATFKKKLKTVLFIKNFLNFLFIYYYFYLFIYLYHVIYILLLNFSAFGHVMDTVLYKMILLLLLLSLGFVSYQNDSGKTLTV